MTTERPLTSQVADRLHGHVIYRSESYANAEKIAQLNEQIRSALIGCTVSQLEDILRLIERTKDISEQEASNG